MRVMNKCLIILALICCTGATTYAGIKRNVLAHSSGGWSWFAQVKPQASVAVADQTSATEETLIFARQNGPGQQWHPLPSLAGRALALAGRSSQLAVLMSDGQWLTVWAEGSATGQPLPAEGRIKTIADDGGDLWAVGEVSGGIIAVNLDIAKRQAATRPTTGQTQSEPYTVSSGPADLHQPAKLVLFHQLDGRWVPLAQMPGDAEVTSPDDVSLAIISDTPVVSFRTFKNAIRTVRFDKNRNWEDIGWITPPLEQAVANFCVLSDGFKPMLWWTIGNQAGELFSDPSGHVSSMSLLWNGSDKLDGVPTATFSGDYLCVFGPHAEKVFEQRYKLDGTPVENAAELAIPKDLNDSVIPRWLESVFLCSLGFTVGSSIFRQWSKPEESSGPEALQPAPLPLRLAAGLVDALPVIAAAVYLTIKAEAVGKLIALPTRESIVVFVSAILIYLLHTTLVELLTARSVGKWIFQLKVVSVDGTPANRSQLIIRNLLRIIDPLVMIFISPLGQRSADTVAGTMVVGMNPVESDEVDPPLVSSVLSGEAEADKPDV